MRFKEQLRLLFLKSVARAIRPRGKAARSSYRRVLVIRPDHLGDLVLSTLALQRLRGALPDAHISLLVGPWNQEAAEHIPCVDQVLTFPFPWFDRQPKRAIWDPYLLLRQEAKRLRAHQWDLAFIMRADFWWGAMLSAWAGIPERVGYDLPETRPFLTKAVPYVPGHHEAAQDLNLVEVVWPAGSGPAEASFSSAFVPSLEDKASAEQWLEQHENPQTLVVLHPGAGAAVKQWGAERFSAVADALAAEYGAKVVVSGTVSERALVKAVASGGRGQHFRLIGASLGQLVALLQRCTLAIGVDSGIMHLASALEVPTVRLYGPVDPARFGPWGDDPGRHRVVRAELPCVPCNRLDFAQNELPFHPCVRAITVNAVLEAARPFLVPTAFSG